MLHPDFFLFDDDPVNNTLCQITIKRTLKDAKIKTFLNPERGFQYIAAVNPDNHKKTILFLDINMHDMTCWEFLEKFENLDDNIKSKFRIYILSASLSITDKELAAANKNVVAFVEKPLTKEKINNIVAII